MSYGGIRNPLHKLKRCMSETLCLRLRAPYFYPTENLQAYLDRPAIFGRDDRGGAMALWFAVEMEQLARTPRRS